MADIAKKSPCGRSVSCENCPHPCSLRILASEKKFAAEALENTAGIETLSECSVGIDIGTTTLAFALYSHTENRVVSTYTDMNPQRQYGTDVISRIKAAKDLKTLKNMQALIVNALENGILKLFGSKTTDCICEIAIAGNTVMTHLLMGWDPSGLGSYPFTPQSLDLQYKTWGELFSMPDCDEVFFLHNDKAYSEFTRKILNVPVLVFPCASAYIGGDIVSGLYSIENKKNSILLDLGTNGEIVLNTDKGVFSASASAGPAFEGGQICFGTGSIPGAICDVQKSMDRTVIKTINNEKPTGICGSGIISLLSLLLKKEYMDETGLLIEPYFSTGFPLTENITFYQKDIRQIQLAKAAIGTGLTLLLSYAGQTLENIDTFYISGSFGSHIDIDAAVNIGLLPDLNNTKYKIIGNSSLKGTIAYLSSPLSVPERKIRLTEISSEIKELLLSQQEEFENLYYENINF